MMKMKALGALCKDNSVFSLFDEVTEDGEIMGQWLGTVDALYLLTGLPYLTEENLIAMFDITEKQKEKISFRTGPLPENLNFENSTPGEILLDRKGATLFYGARTLMPLFTQGGIEFINADLLSPFANTADGIELYERHTVTGKTYFAVKFGLLIAAVIWPLDIINEEFVRWVEVFAGKCRFSLDAKAEKARRAAADDPVQTEL